MASHWDRYALYANFCHKPDVPDAPLAGPVDPLSLFPTPDHYQNYMSLLGKWGTQLEINVLAVILRTPILVWKLETKKAMDIINYDPTSNDSANTIHIVHCNGNHYEALSHRGGASINEILTHELARQQAQERTLIVIPDNHDHTGSDAHADKGHAHCSLAQKKRRSTSSNDDLHDSLRRRLNTSNSFSSIRPFPIKRRAQSQSSQVQQEPINLLSLRITTKDRNILKRLAPNGCNTLTRRPQKRRKESV